MKVIVLLLAALNVRTLLFVKLRQRDGVVGEYLTLNCEVLGSPQQALSIATHFNFTVVFCHGLMLHVEH